ncbi:MAG: ABC transporter permease [Spirochaetes bacterium]|nr:ABC transporter permease [Spirochaetota bacterium]
MKLLAAIIKKELLEIIRDIQSLFLLILMPAAFILVMSLTLQGLFQPDSDFTVKIIAADLDRSPESARFLAGLKSAKSLSITELREGVSSDELLGSIKKGHYNFGLVINRDFSASFRNIARAPQTPPMDLYVEPAIQSAIQMGVKNHLVMEFLKQRTGSFFDKNRAVMSYAGITKESFLLPIETMLATRYVLKGTRSSTIPNAAQQSVPAWLVFSMYFIVMPISLIFHTEKNNGTLSRMRSINLNNRYLIAGKLAAYYIISMIQVVGMLCVGRFIVPLLGGDTISFGNSWAGLYLIASSVGCNAIAYGLLISVASKNTQMAGSLGSILIIILSAIGGIMVPKFVMPSFMQRLSAISPLSWGLDGFLDITLRNGSIADIAPECALLLATSIIMLAATGIILKKKIL